MTATPRLPRSAARHLARIDQVLQATYKTPESVLGNKTDPLDEAVYIILSFQTGVERAKEVWSELRRAFPTWENLHAASTRRVARTLRLGGLHEQKARTIKRLLRSVKRQAGRLSLDFLRDLDDREAERFLICLPGLSWKAARCVLLYSLGRRVLPIDSNTFRILKRTSVLPRRAVYRRRTVHDAIQAAVPAHRRRALHVNLVVHGQRTCLPRAPRCLCCPLNADCPRIGLPGGAGGHLPVPFVASVEARAARADARA